MKTASPKREGITSLIALVCLAVAMTLVLQASRVSLLCRRGLTVAERQMQTNLLLQGGLARAQIQLRMNPEYGGEKWELPADSLGGHSGLVTIEIQRPRDQRKRITVSAEYPHDSADPIRRKQTLELLP